MGLLGRVKSIVLNDITCPEKYKDNLVYMHKARGRRIKIGSNLLVKSNYVALIVAKDKVTDVFSEGRHKLSLPSMPKTTKKLKLNKLKKNKKTKRTKVKKYFRADIYFVRIDKFEEEQFTLANKLLIEDEKFGKFRVSVIGEVTFNAIDPQKLMKALLILWGKVSNGMGKAQVLSWISQSFYRNLNKRDLNLRDLTGDIGELCSRVTGDITAYAESLGLQLEYVSIKKVIFPKKLARKIGKMGIDYAELGAFNRNNISEELDASISNSELQDNRLILDESYSVDTKIKEKPRSFKEELDNFRKGEYNLLKSDGLDCKSNTAKKTATIVKTSVKESSNKDYKICPKCGSAVKDTEFVCPNCRAVVIN